MSSLSCPAAGWCVSIGNYDSDVTPSLPTEGMILVESSDGFRSVQAPLPADASTSDPFAYLSDVTCPEVGACVVLGTYTSTSSGIEAFVDTLSAGAWSASTLPLPADATGAASNLAFPHVSCASVGNCVAVGSYSATDGSTQSVLETAVAGSWSAQEAPVPDNAYSGTQENQLSDVSCPSTDSCVAVGTYAVSPTQSQGFAETLSGGIWSPTELPLPPDANTTPTAGGVGVGSTSFLGWAVSCPAVGECVVAGHYYSTGDETAPDGAEADLLDTLSDGTWTALSAPLPSDAVVPQPLFDDNFTLACSPTGSCVAAGYYAVEPSGSGVVLGFMDTLSGGTWTSAKAPVPAGITGDGTMYPYAVACPSQGQCVVAGNEGGAGGGAFYENQDGTSWVATQAPVPGVDMDTNPSPSIWLTNLSCPAPGGCTDGLTADSSGVVTEFLETDPSLPASTTTVDADPADPASGEAVTLSAAVTSGTTSPTGTVTFWSGLVDLCSAAIAGGTASCDVSKWPTETANVGASYSGDATAAPSSATRSTVLPTVTAVAPSSGPLTGGTHITIHGTGFVDGAVVEIGQGYGAGPSAIKATSVDVVSGTEITAVTGSDAKAGQWNLYVITSGGTSAESSGDAFTYTS